MPRVRVGLRLRFVKLPHIDGERVFRDVISFVEPEDRSYDDLRALVEAKVRFMELSHSDFTAFHIEEHTGDRVVVDTAYFSALLRQWARRAAKERPPPKRPTVPEMAGLAVLGESPSPFVNSEYEGHFGSGGMPTVPTSNMSSDDDVEDDERPPDMLECFEIELQSSNSVAVATAAAIPNLASSVSGAMPSPVQFAALTRENLARLCDGDVAKLGASALLPASGTASPGKQAAGIDPRRAAPNSHLPDPNAEVLVRVRDLTCPPGQVKFYLCCIILAVRFKTPKPGLTVAELDLGDAEDVTQAITAVSFDEVVHKAIRDHLRGDRRQVLELRQVYVRRKNDVDVRYQTNAHPLLLRLDRSSKMEVVRILATPAPQPGSGAIVTVREQLGSAGVVDAAQLMRQPQRLRHDSGGASGAPSSENGVSLSGVGSGAYPPVCSSSSSSSGPRRTTFTMCTTSGNTGASAALVNGVVPSSFGQELRSRQEMLLRQQRSAGSAPIEPGVAIVTARDVREREPLVEQHANREEQRKMHIRRKVEVSTQCLLCGLDCSDESACMAIVRQQLMRSSRNRGAQVPNFAQVKRDLSDRRRVPEGKVPTRLVCTHTFVNSATRTVHVVHPRCAHLCSAYQSGGELEDIVVCDLRMNVCTLCGMPGACVACYHPRCTEMFHVVCALYSGGYVNFGQRDPFWPCPACPRHTQVVVVSKKRPEGSNVLHVDHSCWEDGIAFDSRVVESTDLRDPDENDGE
uniref:PHD-like_zinc-binding_domain_containing_protein_p utative/Pfam:PF13771 n=1 Tax=Leishmania donovani TaxID=5661 RepID=A0A6J8FQN9_LEIDO|nr:PHD-like_zinc-binding_domain_containing_protein_putative/Pfam:PF13771 [Leishmania donovani]